MARTYYDAHGNQAKILGDMQAWQWDRDVPEIEKVKCRGFKGLPYVLGLVDGEKVAIARVVDYKDKNPSRHKCGARCRNAKGPSCECECGGEFHGADA